MGGVPDGAQRPRQHWHLRVLGRFDVAVHRKGLEILVQRLVGPEDRLGSEAIEALHLRHRVEVEDAVGGVEVAPRNHAAPRVPQPQRRGVLAEDGAEAVVVEARCCLGSGVSVRDGPAPLAVHEVALQEGVGLADDGVGVLAVGLQASNVEKDQRKEEKEDTR